MKNLKELLINFGITLLLFIAIFSLFDLNEVVNVLINSDYYFLGLAVLAYIGVVTVMAIRIKMILDELKHHIPFLSLFKSNLAGMIASDFTPARSGYFFTAFSISAKNKIPINNSILTIFGPQLFDFAIKATSLSIMIILILNLFDGFGENILITIGSVVGVFGVIGFFGALVFVKGFVKRFLFLKKIPFGTKIYGLFYLMQENSHKLMNIKWKIIGITFVSWGIKAFEWFLLSKALGIVIFDGGILDYLFILIFQGSTTLIQFIPLPTLAGGGASEAGFAGILFLFGIPLETGLAFALLTRFVMISIDVLGVGEIINYVRKEGVNKMFKEIDSLEHF